ncbi:LysR family transcriptional regulator ArgP [Salinarimonas soli]|uniref:LysR family transcriptional regulator ArgP n=1 Tax=Salinarimonas soli TaxID=1638099 RepID=A0A5B2VBW2_9HYPH|nr:LysR family transcriptional regulator ArgP [Salinarimonas soli]KAA2236454.1 LysR family transcriptional regulator ArgP [Salinarimonas soli]
MLDYAGLSALAAVVRQGSFERAAAAVGVTPSAVSQRVRALEERMGTVLVIRGQPCQATTAGARLCAHVERVTLLEGELVSDLPELGHLGPGAPATPTIRVAVNSDSLGSWFMPAAAAFADSSGALLDIVLDDEEHTADRLRSGEVLAAITTHGDPVQGCRTICLGGLVYVATASPAFICRWFADGVTPETLARAPHLRFDRRDELQVRWARDAFAVALEGPVHWVPATQGFVDGTLAGLGWAMNPVLLAQKHLEAGRLIEFVPGARLEVTLYWQCARLGGRLLDGLTRAVTDVARLQLRGQFSTTVTTRKI